MHLTPTCDNFKKQTQRCSFQLEWLFIALLLLSFSANAQNCPNNIDFEQGNFNGWICYTGSTASVGGSNVISVFSSNGPQNERHTMYAANTGEKDFFGGFPVSCPNGSGYSIRLGNAMGGGEAEAISYEFTIPANQNSYSLIYHYAVVFEAPNHLESQQPRMEIEIDNLSDNRRIECASFTFIASGSSLPGFQYSTSSVDTTSVLYKDWTAVSVDLSGNAGKTIRLTFKTADCTFRKHFGYAYIDVNTGCSGTFTGATYCPDDTAINVYAPYGYQSYTWTDSSLTNVLGTQQILTLSPPPPSGTTIAVKVDPFFGYGCSQVLYAKLIDSLTIKPNAGKDALVCNEKAVQIGEQPIPGLVYKWSPTLGLSNPLISNPLANPPGNTTYILNTSSSGGGCRVADTVNVVTSTMNNDLTFTGKPMFCTTDNDSAVLQVQFTDRIQWLKNSQPIPGANGVKYKATSSGNYSALLQNRDGCELLTTVQPIIIESPLHPVTYPTEYAVVNYPLPLMARTFAQSVRWNPPTGLNNATTVSPNFIGTRDQLYTITLRTQAGCVTVDTQLVKVIKEVEVLVPTAFTPNNDGRNDRLKPILIGIKDTRYFRIYNRWGQVMFESRTPLPGWDGKFKGMPAGMQTIVWIYEGIGVDNKLYLKKGTSVLLR